MFAYDDWANREVLASLRSAEAPPQQTVRLMAHIIAVEWLWLGRLKQERKPVVVWPELTLAECAQQQRLLPPAWAEYFGALFPGRLAASIAYVNSKGEHWSNTVEDILMHTVMHSAYHRGQIASATRAAGFTPAYTDFIEGVRRKLVE
jgi:uncharacterized damage-inducible protein DinB